MRMRWLAARLRDVLIRRVADVRPPDVYIGGEEDPYLVRWYVIPRNRFFNIYLNEMHRSDDERAMHDHPWPWASLILRGSYVEYIEPNWPEVKGRSGLEFIRIWEAGSFRVRRATMPHRLGLRRAQGQPDQWEWPLTLFLTGPKIREWGFWCPQGWRHWRDFTDATGARVGRGCE